MTCQYGRLQKIVRSALSKVSLSSSSLSLSLSCSHLLFLSYSSTPLALPAAPVSLPGLSFIYRKAFTEINTATKRLHTPTHIHTCNLCTHSLPRFWRMIRAKQNKAVLGSPVCLILVFRFVDCSRSTHLHHLSPVSFLIAFLPSSVFSPWCLYVPVRKQRPEMEELVWGVGGQGEDGES